MINRLSLFLVLLTYGISAFSQTKKPKRIVFLIGDGMGLAQITGALANYAGQNAFERFNTIGFSKTNSSDNYITDSAAGATAFTIGQKTYNGAIGVDSLGKPIETIFESIKKQTNWRTGVVATSSITHATPASFYAHAASRKSEEDIAEFLLNQNCDLAIGGGSKFLVERNDKRNLATELTEKGYTVITDSVLTKNTSFKLVQTLQKDGLKKILDGRGDILKNASLLAINNLGANTHNFMLMIEGSQIDWGGHDTNFLYMQTELIDFNETINAVLDYAIKDGNTLVVVTADHETGGLSLLEDKKNKKNNFKTNYASTSHSGIMVPVFAYGPGAELFAAIYHNTQIYYKFKQLINLK